MYDVKKEICKKDYYGFITLSFSSLACVLSHMLTKRRKFESKFTSNVMVKRNCKFLGKNI